MKIWKRLHCMYLDKQQWNICIIPTLSIHKGLTQVIVSIEFLFWILYINFDDLK